jgi:hypothetical protein
MDNQKKMGAFRRIGLAGLLASSTFGLSGCIGWAVPVHTPNGTMYYTQSIPVPTNANQDEPIRPIIIRPIQPAEGTIEYRQFEEEGVGSYSGMSIFTSGRWKPHGQGIVKALGKNGVITRKGGYYYGKDEGYGETEADGRVYKGYWHNDKWVGETKEDYERALKADNEVANTKQG